MDRYRITLVFETGEVVSVIETDEDNRLHEGIWVKPFPNTAEDSLAFGLIETYSQSDGPVQAGIYEYGRPVQVMVTKDITAPISL